MEKHSSLVHSFLCFRSLFIYDLFNDAVSSSEHVALNDNEY